MKISVIVPIYKAEKYLDECILSILNQTYKNLEILLIDDGSPDNSGGICDMYAEKDSRIKVFHIKNGGQAAARNFGIGIATGELVTFVDSDDIIKPNMYSVLADEIKKGAQLAMCGIYRFYENGTIKNEAVTNAFYCSAEKIRQTLLMQMLYPINGENVITPSACRSLFLKSILIENKVLFPNERQYLGEDLIFNLSYFAHIESASITENYFYGYRTNKESFTNNFSYSPNRLQSVFNMAELIKNILLVNGLYDEAAALRLNAKILDSISVCIKLSVMALSFSQSKSQMKAALENKLLIDALNARAYRQCNSFLKTFSLLLKHRFFYIIYLLTKLYVKLFL